jgi:hypothetical protein
LAHKQFNKRETGGLQSFATDSTFSKIEFDGTTTPLRQLGKLFDLFPRI